MGAEVEKAARQERDTARNEDQTMDGVLAKLAQTPTCFTHAVVAVHARAQGDNRPTAAGGTAGAPAQSPPPPTAAPPQVGERDTRRRGGRSRQTAPRVPLWRASAQPRHGQRRAPCHFCGAAASARGRCRRDQTRDTSKKWAGEDAPPATACLWFVSKRAIRGKARVRPAPRARRRCRRRHPPTHPPRSSPPAPLGLLAPAQPRGLGANRARPVTERPPPPPPSPSPPPSCPSPCPSPCPPSAPQASSMATLPTSKPPPTFLPLLLWLQRCRARHRPPPGLAAAVVPVTVAPAVALPLMPPPTVALAPTPPPTPCPTARASGGCGRPPPQRPGTAAAPAALRPHRAYPQRHHRPARRQPPGRGVAPPRPLPPRPPPHTPGAPGGA